MNISEESEKRKRKKREAWKQTKAPRVKVTINTLCFRSDLIWWLMWKSIQSATLL